MRSQLFVSDMFITQAPPTVGWYLLAPVINGPVVTKKRTVHYIGAEENVIDARDLKMASIS